ncbi:MAG: hypothetical protein J6K04_10710 [Lachnospiraceae bacterium]|nr:hypothetical protein [Lachnospiraceae bacterium]
MGTYTVRWEERKSFLFSSMVIGAVLAVCFAALLLYLGKDEIMENLLPVIGTALISFLLFTAIIAVGRLVFGKNAGGNFATNAVNGLWCAVINSVTGGGIGLVIGLLIFFIFFWLFLIVAAYYAIYLPISSVYLFIKHKQEVA